jgi:ABC-type nitrate/sulfonate/bicarbonate transport system substrate-binding protein
MLNGAPVKGVMGITNRGTQSFVVKPEINSAADLKGKIVGVSGFGGSTHHGALLVLEHLGLDPKDVSILNVGNSSLRLAALRFKKIDVTILDTAFVRKAEEWGLKRLVSLADLGEIPSTGITVTTTKLKEQPDQIRRAIRATLQGTSYFKKNRSEMISFITRKLAVETKEAEELFDLGVKVFSNNGRISDEGLGVLLRQRDPKRQTRVKPSDFVDWSLLPAKAE